MRKGDGQKSGTECNCTQQDLKTDLSFARPNEQKKVIQMALARFINDLRNQKTEFIAFRKYVLRHIIAQILKEILS